MSRQVRTKRAKWCRFISIITGKLLYIKKKEGSFEINSEEDLVNFMELLDISTNNDLDEIITDSLLRTKNMFVHNI